MISSFQIENYFRGVVSNKLRVRWYDDQFHINFSKYRQLARDVRLLFRCETQTTVGSVSRQSRHSDVGNLVYQRFAQFHPLNLSY